MVPATDTVASYAEPLPDAFAGVDPAAAAAAVRGSLDAAGVTFGGRAEGIRVDPVPRVLTAEEWDRLDAGLCQRVRALERFVADVYGPRRIVSDGVLDTGAIATAEYFEPLMQLALRSEHRLIGVAGLDCVRGSDGVFRILEDNLRTPSGLGYTAAIRAAVTEHIEPPDGLRPVDPFTALHEVLRAAAPDGVDAPVLAVISDGPGNVAYYEHRAIAARLGIPIFEVGELRVRDGHLYAGPVRVDVAYRRTDEDRLVGPRGGLTDVARLLFEPWAAGSLGLVNAFGTGVADDKLLHAHVETMVRYYLAEEPLLESVETFDLSRPGVLPRALDRLEELVVKPRAGHGGAGVVIGPIAGPAELGAAADALRAAPLDYVVQEFVALSLHPTVVEGRLEPRHVDLRPFVFYGAGEPVALPGGLTRVALDEGEMVVNSSRNGGVKDTWVIG